MADTSVQIKLTTTADTSGADKLNASLGITASREKELAAIRAQFMSAAEAEVATVNKLAAASIAAAKAREAEIEAAKRKPLLAAGVERERVEVDKLIASQRQLNAERSKPAAAVNPWGTAGAGQFQRTPQFIQQLNEFDAAQGRVARSASNSAQSMYIFSQGLEDAQYGIRGVLNNIPQLVTSLGGGLGLAGGISIAAVAVQTLGPHVVQWFKSLDTEGKKLDELKTKLSAAATAILGEWTPASQAAKDEADQFTEALKKQSDAFTTLDKAQQASLDILKKRQSVDAEIAKTKEENDIADIKAKNLPKDEEARAIAAVKLQKAKDDRARELGTMQGEQTIAGEAVNNAAKEAEAAEAQKKKLEAEKRLSIREAKMQEAQKRAVEKLEEERGQMRATELAAGQAGPAGAQMVADQRKKIESAQAALAAIESERQKNVELNGGSSQFRKVETIDAELSQADSAVAAAAKKKQDAEFQKSQLDKLQFEQKRKVENDFSQAQTKAVGGLEDKPRTPKMDHPHDLSDPFERKPAPRRNLVAEEAAGGGASAENKGRSLVEAMEKAAKERAEADAIMIKRFDEQAAESRKLKEQLKNSRS